MRVLLPLPLTTAATALAFACAFAFAFARSTNKHDIVMHRSNIQRATEPLVYINKLIGELNATTNLRWL